MQKVIFKTKTVGNKKVNFINPEGIVYKEGDEEQVTEKAAIWLSANGFIETTKKENKQAAKRQTK